MAGTNLYAVAVHEIGHSLGVLHSREKGALMYPWYPGYTTDLRLHQDDVAAIEALYGIAVLALYYAFYVIIFFLLHLMSGLLSLNTVSSINNINSANVVKRYGLVALILDLKSCD